MQKEKSLREKILRKLLKNPPYGDNENINKSSKYKISCNIVFYKRLDLLNGILTCLQNQNFKDFEVVLVEDKGITKETKDFLKKFSNLNIKHVSPKDNYGRMGYMRNYGLRLSEGEIILFLDDDTIILDNEFLLKLYDMFSQNKDLMAVIPRGFPLYADLNHKYEFHDPYFFTNRCMAYRKQVLQELKGFDDNFIGQEDVEFAVRFLAKGYKYLKTDKIFYLHPPFIVKKISKAKAVGFSFAKSKYSFFMKLLLLINGCRWLPLFIFPTFKNIQHVKFSLGYLIGFLKGVFNKNKNLLYS